MPRKPRIEFSGAMYHVMCRGNRQEKVFKDDKDRECFLDTLEEVCGRAGWRIFSFVLMGNHYHLLLETPEANLVAGMRWFQSTYTQRFNHRHKECGHLFQGRYKALLVGEGDEYFSTVVNYVHLNPARAKLFDLEKGKLMDYVWSSYPSFIRLSKRPAWLDVKQALFRCSLADDARGRRAYQNRMQKRVLEILHSENPWEVDKVWHKIRRGWYFGAEGFRDELLNKLNDVMKGGKRESLGGDAVRMHDEQEAERILNEGLQRLGLSEDTLKKMRKGAIVKQVLAWYIHKQTMVSNAWLARRLHSGHPSGIPSFIKRVKEGKTKELKERVRQIIK